MAEEPRNEQRRQIQWELLMMSFIFGFVVAVLVMPERVRVVTIPAPVNLDSRMQTATQLVVELTLTNAPRMTLAPLEILTPGDTLNGRQTATELVRRATLTAAPPLPFATPVPIDNDPIFMTASQIIRQVTETSAAPTATPSP
jgi:hypothetical protein